MTECCSYMPGVEPATSRSWFRHRNHWITTPHTKITFVYNNYAAEARLYSQTGARSHYTRFRWSSCRTWWWLVRRWEASTRRQSCWTTLEVRGHGHCLLEPSCSHLNCVWIAFILLQYYRPLLEFSSQVWSPHHKYLIDKVESVQRFFTKRLSGLRGLSYCERLNILGS